MRWLIVFLFFSCSAWADSLQIPEKVLICGICQNVEKAVPNTIRSIESLGACFLDYQVIIYENNSHDQTKRLFKNWSKQNPKVLFLSEHVSKKEFAKELAMGKKNRTEVIARARNKVLDVALDNRFHDYKYVIWGDLDFLEPWDVEHIVETILHPEQPWDAVLAYGRYDLFAFRDEKCPIGAELVGDLYWEHLDEVYDRFSMHPTDPWRPVYSAFGGFGIYQRSALEGCRYSGVVTKDLEKVLLSWLGKARSSKEPIPMLSEYETLLQRVSVIDLKGTARLEPRANYPKQIGLRLEGDLGEGKIAYFSCTSNTTLPAICEHIPLHASMILKGRDKIFVNPRLYAFQRIALLGDKQEADKKSFIDGDFR